MIALACIIGLPLGGLALWATLRGIDTNEPDLGNAYRDESTNHHSDPL